MPRNYSALALLLLLAAVGCAAAGTPAGPIFGCRLPRRFIVVQGFGETSEGSGEDPYETGAHDLAMEDAGISQFNLVQYTSMLPAEAEEISMDDAKKSESWNHGAVLECIVAEVHGSRGDRITAGVGRMMVHPKGNRDETVGGFATEYKGHALEDVAKEQLEEALEELFERRFGSDDHEMGEKKFEISTHEVKDAFGTAMAGVCFIDYIFPQIGEPEKA